MIETFSLALKPPEPSYVPLDAFSEICDERQISSNDKNDPLGINASLLLSVNTTVKVLVLANAKAKNLRSKLLVDNAVEVNYSDKNICDDNAIPTRRALKSAEVPSHAEQF